MPAPRTATERPSVLILGCGALARELLAVADGNGLDHVTVECLPGELHNHPERIPVELEARLARAVGDFDRILLGYADCGTGGRLDELCQRYGVTRLPGAHCYELFAGRDAFAELHDREPGTFYLTDYLARHVDRFVFELLGLDRHPELASAYFGNYRRLVHLAQVDDAETTARARAAAERLGLAFERRLCGTGELGSALVAFASGSPHPVTPVISWTTAS